MTFKLKEDNELEFIEFLHNPFNPCKSVESRCASINYICIQEIDDATILASIKTDFIHNHLEQTFDILLSQKFEKPTHSYNDTDLAKQLYSNLIDKIRVQTKYEWIKLFNKELSNEFIQQVLKYPYIPGSHS